MRYIVFTVLLIGALILLFMPKGGGVLDHGNHWRQVGELGGSPYIRVVEVDAASVHNGVVYRDAVTKLCSADSDCWQVGFFLPGDQTPPSGDKSSFFSGGGWANYSPVAVWSGNEFTKWDCDKAGADDAPLSALCGTGAEEQYDAVLHLATRVGWSVGCHLPPTKDRGLVEKFANSQKRQKRDQLVQTFDQMEKASESGPDDPADCQNLKAHIEEEARDARKVLSAF